jgi:predicted alpha/beta-hydrolase family hydrolase
MPKARKTKHTKPQTKKTKKKRQALRNLDNAELKKGNRVAGGSSKKTSQESIVEVSPIQIVNPVHVPLNRSNHILDLSFPLLLCTRNSKEAATKEVVSAENLPRGR